MKLMKNFMLLGIVLTLVGCNVNNEKLETLQDNQIGQAVGVPDEQLTEERTNERDSENKSNEEILGQQDEVIEITEKMYVTYVNEMYTNTGEYEGKKVKLEGMFTSAYDETTKQTYYFVYRTGPGCCNNDGSMCGFEFTTTDPIPMENDWIEVEGTLESYEENGFIYLNLRDAKVTVKDERGQEVVYQ